MIIGVMYITEGVDRGGGGTGIEGAESGVEGAESGVEGAGSGSRGGGKRGNCGRGSGKIGGRNCFFTRKLIKNDSLRYPLRPLSHIRA